MREKINRTVNSKHDEFATAYSTDMWSPVAVGATPGVVSIAAGKLVLTTGHADDVAGLVTKDRINLRNARISVTIDASTSVPDEATAGIIIAPTSVTATNPELEQNCLRVVLDGVTGHLTVFQDVGGVEITDYDAVWTAGAETVSLDIEPDGVFRVLEGAVEMFRGNLPWTSAVTASIFSHYVYLFAVGLGANCGYATFDNFRLDLDQNVGNEVGGEGVRKAAEMSNTVVYGRLMDRTGIQTTFQTDHAITDTPTQWIILSRDVKNFRLDEIRYYMNAANAVTSQLYLLEEVNADDDQSAMHLIYASIAALADAAMYRASTGSHLATGGAVAANDTVLPVTFRLERPGQIPYNQDWSGAPGATKGAIILIGREVD